MATTTICAPASGAVADGKSVAKQHVRPLSSYAVNVVLILDYSHSWVTDAGRLFLCTFRTITELLLVLCAAFIRSVALRSARTRQ